MYTLSRNHVGWHRRGFIAALYSGIWITIREGSRRESKLGGGGEPEDQAPWLSEGDYSEVRSVSLG